MAETEQDAGVGRGMGAEVSFTEEGFDVVFEKAWFWSTLGH